MRMKTLSDSSMLNLNHATKLRMSPIAVNRAEQQTNPAALQSQKSLLSQGTGHRADHHADLMSERGVASVIDAGPSNAALQLQGAAQLADIEDGRSD